MENLKLKATQIVQAEGRGQVQLQLLGKDKKATCTVIISFNDPKEAAKYQQGKEYSVKIDLVK